MTGNTVEEWVTYNCMNTPDTCPKCGSHGMQVGDKTYGMSKWITWHRCVACNHTYRNVT